MTQVAFSGSLQLRLWLGRFGLVNTLVVFALVAGAAAWLVLLPELRSRLFTQQQLLPARMAQDQAGRLQTTIEPPSASVRALAAFYGALGESRFVEQQLKTMFVIAGGLGLKLDQAQYKSGADSPGRFQTYQIVLPVKGSYDQLRQFCEQMLAAIPFAALDEMDLQRAAAGQPLLEARLRFTLFLADSRPLAGNEVAPRVGNAVKP